MIRTHTGGVMCEQIESFAAMALDGVRSHGFPWHMPAKEACDIPLPRRLSSDEERVLATLRAKCGSGLETPVTFPALLFGAPGRWLPKSEQGAFVRLVRRGIVQIDKLTAPSGQTRLRYTINSPAKQHLPVRPAERKRHHA